MTCNISSQWRKIESLTHKRIKLLNRVSSGTNKWSYLCERYENKAFKILYLFQVLCGYKYRHMLSLISFLTYVSNQRKASLRWLQRFPIGNEVYFVPSPCPLLYVLIRGEKRKPLYNNGKRLSGKAYSFASIWIRSWVFLSFVLLLFSFSSLLKMPQ